MWLRVSQTCLLVMIKNWRKNIGNGRVNGAVTTDLPKAFDCKNYNLRISKLTGFGFYC